MIKRVYIGVTSALSFLSLVNVFAFIEGAREISATFIWASDWWGCLTNWPFEMLSLDVAKWVGPVLSIELILFGIGWRAEKSRHHSKEIRKQSLIPLVFGIGLAISILFIYFEIAYAFAGKFNPDLEPLILIGSLVLLIPLVDGPSDANQPLLNFNPIRLWVVSSVVTVENGKIVMIYFVALALLLGAASVLEATFPSVAEMAADLPQPPCAVPV